MKRGINLLLCLGMIMLVASAHALTIPWGMNDFEYEQTFLLRNTSGPYFYYDGMMMTTCEAILDGYDAEQSNYYWDSRLFCYTIWLKDNDDGAWEHILQTETNSRGEANDLAPDDVDALVTLLTRKQGFAKILASYYWIDDDNTVIWLTRMNGNIQLIFVDRSFDLRNPPSLTMFSLPKGVTWGMSQRELENVEGGFRKKSVALLEPTYNDPWNSTTYSYTLMDHEDAERTYYFNDESSLFMVVDRVSGVDFNEVYELDAEAYYRLRQDSLHWTSSVERATELLKEIYHQRIPSDDYGHCSPYLMDDGTSLVIMGDREGIILVIYIASES